MTMLLPRLTALLIAATTAQAFKNTSPFLVVSSDPLPKDAPLQSAQLALTKDVEDRLVDTLSACDKRLYYIDSQKHVSAQDLRTKDSSALRDGLAQAGSVVEIPEVMVMGQLSAENVERRLVEACSSKGKRRVDDTTTSQDEYQIILNTLPAIPKNPMERPDFIQTTDITISTHIASTLFVTPSVYIYITTPPTDSADITQDNHLYEMDDPYPSALHTDLKRDLHEIRKRQAENNNGTDFQKGLGLFEKYQFFTPGLFMALTVSVFLLGILYVGVGAIAGLEVSYAAFNKEMGPQASKGKNP